MIILDREGLSDFTYGIIGSFIHDNSYHVQVHNQKKDGIESNEIPTMSGVDMSAAFDYVCRSKLLRLLGKLGEEKSGIKLLRSYFTNRTESVEIGAKRGRERK